MAVNGRNVVVDRHHLVLQSLQGGAGRCALNAQEACPASKHVPTQEASSCPLCYQETNTQVPPHLDFLHRLDWLHRRAGRHWGRHGAGGHCCLHCIQAPAAPLQAGTGGALQGAQLLLQGGHLAERGKRGAGRVGGCMGQCRCRRSLCAPGWSCLERRCTAPAQQRPSQGDPAAPPPITSSDAPAQPPPPTVMPAASTCGRAADAGDRCRRGSVSRGSRYALSAPSPCGSLGRLTAGRWA